MNRRLVVLLAILAAASAAGVALLFAQPGTGIAFGIGLMLGATGASVAGSTGHDRRPTADPLRGDAEVGWAEFHRELVRARRYERTFAIVRFAGAERDVGATQVRLLDEVSASARRIDRVWVDGNDVLVLLPESTRAAAEALVARIRSRAPQDFGLSSSVACFPLDGLTARAVIAALQGAELGRIPAPIDLVRRQARPALAGSEDRDRLSIEVDLAGNGG
jgi:hypothetical protein